MSNPLEDVPCTKCGSRTLRIEYRQEWKDYGTYSLAGTQNKMVMTEWPWAVCDTCKGESCGKY